MLEIEIKAKINDFDLMKIMFKKNSGIYKISLIHEDTYFNMPQGLRDFKETDEALRVRKSTEYNNNDKNFKQKTNYYLAYKGKKMDKLTKTRKEIEIKVEKGDELKELLKTLGFREIFTVKKERELYEFEHKNRRIEALIDYIPVLKEYFIEVEILSDSKENLDEYRNILFDFLTLFGIKKEDSITKSYLELIADRFRGKRS